MTKHHAKKTDHDDTRHWDAIDKKDRKKYTKTPDQYSRVKLFGQVHTDKQPNYAVKADLDTSKHHRFRK